MKVINYSTFRKHLSAKLDEVNGDKNVTIVCRPNGRNIAIIDEREYYSFQKRTRLQKETDLTVTPAFKLGE